MIHWVLLNFYITENWIIFDLVDTSWQWLSLCFWRNNEAGLRGQNQPLGMEYHGLWLHQVDYKWNHRINVIVNVHKTKLIMQNISRLLLLQCFYHGIPHICFFLQLRFCFVTSFFNIYCLSPTQPQLKLE